MGKNACHNIIYLNHTCVVIPKVRDTIFIKPYNDDLIQIEVDIMKTFFYRKAVGKICKNTVMFLQAE